MLLFGIFQTISFPHHFPGEDQEGVPAPRVWTRGWCEIWIQIWTAEKGKFSLILFVNKIDGWMFLKITEKIIRENAFEQKEKKSGLNLTVG